VPRRRKATARRPCWDGRPGGGAVPTTAFVALGRPVRGGTPSPALARWLDGYARGGGGTKAVTGVMKRAARGPRRGELSDAARWGASDDRFSGCARSSGRACGGADGDNGRSRRWQGSRGAASLARTCARGEKIRWRDHRTWPSDFPRGWGRDEARRAREADDVAAALLAAGPLRDGRPALGTERTSPRPRTWASSAHRERGILRDGGSCKDAGGRSPRVGGQDLPRRETGPRRVGGRRAAGVSRRWRGPARPKRRVRSGGRLRRGRRSASITPRRGRLASAPTGNALPRRGCSSGGAEG